MKTPFLRQIDSTQPTNRHSLLFRNDNSPFVLFVSVHDIRKPALQLRRVLSAFPCSHGDGYIFLAVVDYRHRADEKLGAEKSTLAL